VNDECNARDDAQQRLDERVERGIGTAERRDCEALLGKIGHVHSLCFLDAPHATPLSKPVTRPGASMR